ncbi:MAG: hypothetical protein LT102_03390 [Burkholderiaceae bacterium]|nr:hypothetical protein [Burkholderiaceae bacterium]
MSGLPAALRDPAHRLHGEPARWRAAAIALLPLALAAPSLRSWLESSMPLHMLVQMPLLAAAGFAAAAALPARNSEALAEAIGGALPCLLVAALASTFWMIPRALDLALFQPAVEAAKFVTLPLLVGAPLALAWPRLGVPGRGFVWTNFASMLAVLGWLYRASPLRACNAYRVPEQQLTGEWLVFLAIVVFVGWLATLFVERPAHKVAR